MRPLRAFIQALCKHLKIYTNCVGTYDENFNTSVLNVILCLSFIVDSQRDFWHSHSKRTGEFHIGSIIE